MNCKVCEAKEAEIAFLRQTIMQLIEQKKVENVSFPPMYVNELGDLSTIQETQDDHV